MSVLEITDLRKSFTGPDGTRTPIIDIPRFELADGAQVALAGTSGSGKTTLLNLIGGILRPDTGRIVVAGLNVGEMSEAQRDRFRAEHVSYVFQIFHLLPAYTALENVMLGMMFGKGADAAAARHLLDRVGLADRMDYKPAQLSVGQQQRVALARALANRPMLVLADEPTGNLDAKHKAEAIGLMREICRESGAALLVVSHDRDALEKFEQVHQLAEINRALSGSDGR